MKIGSLALEQARGRIDAERVRAEGDRLLENLGRSLAEHQRSVADQIGTCLKDYFDPESGRFNERVERLIRKDGELERLLRSQIGSEGSELAQTLAMTTPADRTLITLGDFNSSPEDEPLGGITPPYEVLASPSTGLTDAWRRNLLAFADPNGFTCCQNADLANPTSNAIYVRLGYEPVCDSRELAFSPC